MGGTNGIMQTDLSNKPPPGANEIATVVICPDTSSETTWNFPPREPARSIARKRAGASSSRPPVMARMVTSVECGGSGYSLGYAIR